MKCFACKSRGPDDKFIELAPGVSVCKNREDCFCSSLERALTVIDQLDTRKREIKLSKLGLIVQRALSIAKKEEPDYVITN